MIATLGIYSIVVKLFDLNEYYYENELIQIWLIWVKKKVIFVILVLLE
jgi:hypothetical protein